MNKLHSSLIVTSVLMALPYQADAWSKNASAFEEPKVPETLDLINEPDNRVWRLEADYLFWKPYQDDLIFATKKVQETLSGTTFVKFKPQNPNFNLSSGVRLGIGGYLADRWDLLVRGTYYYTEGKEVSKGNGGATQLFPSFFPGFHGEDGTKASGFWKLNFGLLDLTLGREYCLTNRVSFHPYIGVRTAWINQNFRGLFTGVQHEGSAPFPVIRSKNQSSNNIWGIGPRVGFDLSYYFCSEWSFKGGLSGAFIYGQYHVNQKALTTITSVSNGAVTFQDIRGRDSNNFIRSNLDAYLGLGWDRWFNNGDNRVYVALLCETSYWYHINQYMDFVVGTNAALPDTPTRVQTQKRNGDLAFFGGTIHLQIDF